MPVALKPEVEQRWVVRPSWAQSVPELATTVAQITQWRWPLSSEIVSTLAGFKLEDEREQRDLQETLVYVSKLRNTSPVARLRYETGAEGPKPPMLAIKTGRGGAQDEFSATLNSGHAETLLTFRTNNHVQKTRYSLGLDTLFGAGVAALENERAFEFVSDAFWLPARTRITINADGSPKTLTFNRGLVHVAEIESNKASPVDYELFRGMLDVMHDDPMSPFQYEATEFPGLVSGLVTAASKNLTAGPSYL